MLCSVSEGAGRVGLRVRGVHCRCRPELADALRELYQRWDWVYQALASRPEATFLAGRRPVVVGVLGQRRVLVKRLYHGGFLAPLTGDRFLSPWRALTNLAVADTLAARGIATPDVLFVAWRRGGVVVRMEMGFEVVEGSEDAAAAAFGRDGRPPKDAPAVMAAVGRLVAALHRAGVYHCDLNLKNFLLTPSGQVMILDVDKASVGARPLGVQARRRNLNRLARSVRKLGRGVVSPSEIEGLLSHLVSSYETARATE